MQDYPYLRVFNYNVVKTPVVFFGKNKYIYVERLKSQNFVFTFIHFGAYYSFPFQEVFKALNGPLLITKM